MNINPLRKVGERFEYGDFDIVLKKDPDNQWIFKIFSETRETTSSGRYLSREAALENAMDEVYNSQPLFQVEDIIKDESSAEYFIVTYVDTTNNEYELSKLNSPQDYWRMMGSVNRGFIKVGHEET